MRRLASIILVLALLLLAAPSTVEAAPWAERLTLGDYEYTVNEDGSATITKYTGSDAKLIIPGEIDGRPVTGIRSGAILRNDTITDIIIPEGVTDIEGNPFYDCRALRNIEVSPGNPVYAVVDRALISLPEMRLVACPAGSLPSKYTVPEGIEIIGDRAFGHCDVLRSVVIPEGVVSIESGAFSFCSHLESVTIPGSVVSVGGEAFHECTALERVELGSGVREVPANPFTGCEALDEIVVSPGNPALVVVDGVLFHESEARLITYPGGRAAGRYEVPEGTKVIGAEAFFSVGQLTEIVIPEGVTEIGHTAFLGCAGLTGVVIPESALTLGHSIFVGCIALDEVTLPGNLSKIPESMFYHCTELTTLTIPEGVGSIGFGAFRDCFSLTTLTIPEGVSSIGYDVFTGSDKLTLTVYEGSYAAGYAERDGIPCEYLAATPAPTPAATPTATPRPLRYRNYEYTLNEDGSATITRYTGEDERELTIPEELGGHPVTAIGEYAFRGGNSIVTLTIPDGIREIGTGAFGFCQILERVIIGAGVTGIGDNPFRGSNSLKYIEVAPGNPVLSVVNGALIYEPEGRLITYPAGLTDKSYEIPEGVESIGESAFIYCTGLTDIILPGSVRSIGSEAFSYCSGLERAALGGGVRELGTNPFFWCTALKDIEIAPGNEALEVRDGSLIYLPDMRLIAYSGGLSAEEYEVPDGVKTIGEYAFSDCPSLVSVTLPEGVTEVGECAFGYCPALTSVTLPEGITEIPALAFTQCTALTTLTIPESVSVIGWGAFNACDNLTLKVYVGSYGAKYAEYYKIPYEYAD